MTIHHCAVCGERGTGAEMIVSRQTGNAYCIDTRGCEERQKLAGRGVENITTTVGTVRLWGRKEGTRG